jgi:fusion and transport protein UGO1
MEGRSFDLCLPKKKYCNFLNLRKISPIEPQPATMKNLKRKAVGTSKFAQKRRAKKARDYHSSSSDTDPEPETQKEQKQEVEAAQQEEDDDKDSIGGDDTEDDSASDFGSSASDDEIVQGKLKKRNDPAIFATSISKILNAKLSTSKRVDPVLSRSKEAAEAVKEIGEARLEAKARQKIRADKKTKLETGRVRDVLGLNSTEISTETILEQEKKYKKIAQRGVVRMFNAIRAAQVMGEQAARDANKQGVIGIDQREQKVNEMSKKGFLELIAGGGKK